MRTAIFAWALPLALACGEPDSGRPAAEGAPPDLVLLSVDTLRPDHLGLYGYARDTSPRLDRFFASGRIYTRAYGTSASTSPSVVSLLTGLRPPEHGVRLFYQLVPEDIGLLTERLPQAYQSAAFVSNIVLTEEALGIAERFDHYDDYVDEQESARKIWERRADRTTEAALAWLREERDPERPLFLWLHYIDPHGPYRPPEEWAGRFEDAREHPVEIERIYPHQREEGVRDAWDYVDRYDEEIAFVDAQIGRLLDGYGPRLDDALVVFTSDHGETMIEHERWFTHGYRVYEAILRVPLMLRGPGVEAGRDERLVQGTDVAPTLLRAAGAPVPAAMPAVDLRTGSGLRDDRILVGEATGKTGQWLAAIQGEEKSTLRVHGAARNVEERKRYGLEDDPGEQQPRVWDYGVPTARALLEFVRDDPDPAGVPRELEAGMRLSAPKVAPRADEEALEKLRALGYAE